jgi:hypothetical protein
MANSELLPEAKSVERLAFEYWLRTGRHLTTAAEFLEAERKFNPYHDPENGQFTFGPGGTASSAHRSVSITQRYSGATRHAPARTRFDSERRSAIQASFVPDPDANATDRNESEPDATLQPANYTRNPRAGIGGNNGAPLNDPMTIQRVFPAIQSSPAGSIVAVADNILDLTSPSTRLTSGLAAGHVNQLIRQIQTIDPTYKLDSLAFPATMEGQVNLIRQLRVERATAMYRIHQETGPLQVETLRFLQERTDRAYDDGVSLYNAGKLNVRLSREEAIGSHVDRATRRELRNFYNRNGIEPTREGPIRVIGREYDNSGTDLTYRIPDNRVANIAFDVSLTRKTLGTAQVRGFFNSDFRPDFVVIVRPTQLGPGSTYVISNPRTRP